MLFNKVRYSHYEPVNLQRIHSIDSGVLPTLSNDILAKECGPNMEEIRKFAKTSEISSIFYFGRDFGPYQVFREKISVDR